MSLKIRYSWPFLKSRTVGYLVTGASSMPWPKVVESSNNASTRANVASSSVTMPRRSGSLRGRTVSSLGGALVFLLEGFLATLLVLPMDATGARAFVAAAKRRINAAMQRIFYVWTRASRGRRQRFVTGC